MFVFLVVVFLVCLEIDGYAQDDKVEGFRVGVGGFKGGSARSVRELVWL